MSGKLPDRNQREIFHTRLEDLIDPHHSLALLADAIDWKYFENEFKIYTNLLISKTKLIWVLLVTCNILVMFLIFKTANSQFLEKFDICFGVHYRRIGCCFICKPNSYRQKYKS